MRLKDISFSSPEENLLFDDILLQMAEQGVGGEILRFWESPQFCIILGRTGIPEKELIQDAVDRDGLGVFRRSSGGGTVLQGPGCLNYTWILDKNSDARLHDIRKSYEFILGQVIRVLSLCGISAEWRPISDLILPEKEMKFSGNAQKRGRRFILHHGTFLYDFPLDLISKYLRMPESVPPYRQGRPHHEFVVNLPVPSQQIKKAFLKYFALSSPERVLSFQESEYFLSQKSRRQEDLPYYL